MPLAKVEKINNSSWWALWKISESEREMEELLNSNYNHEDLYSISHPQKRLEWYGGRLAVKSLMECVGEVFCGVSKDLNNKPYTIGSSCHISITHSFPYAAAIISTAMPVGIDIEIPREKLLKVASRFLSHKELQYCENDLVKLCTFWCAKEALYKKYGEKKLIFQEQIFINHSESTQYELQGIISSENNVIEHRMVYKMIDDHIICYNID